MGPVDNYYGHHWRVFVAQGYVANRRGALRWMAAFGLCLASRRASLAAALSGAEVTLTLGRTFYVATTGDDSHPGTPQLPFRTITGALAGISDLGGGDTIIVMPGTYNEQVVVNKGGDTKGYVTLRSLIKYGAFIRSPKNSYSAVNITKDFVIVDGFDVQAGGNGHGIEATFIDSNPKNNGPHHIKIVNNICHNSAGSGIGVAYGDFYTIEGNICCYNCHSNEFQGSGISIYEARAISDQTEGFHNFIRNNICFRNIAFDLPGDPEPSHSDGNGIIVDDLHNSQTKKAENYRFGTLVENNVLYNNGGKGVQIFLSDNVTIRNNTSYHNNLDQLNPSTWRGEFSNINSSNNLWINNIGVADPAINSFNTAISEGDTPEYINKDVLWYNNLTYDGTPGQPSLHFSGKNKSLTGDAPYNNIFGVDPKFFCGEDGVFPNFQLQAGSPALNAGTTSFGVASTDLGDNPRVVGWKIDIGAYEDQGRPAQCAIDRSQFPE
jgi:hypothetical protein